MKKFYYDGENFVSASAAMAAHRNGKTVNVGIYTDEFEFVKNIHIQGAKKPERDAEKENRAQCKHIALEIEEYAAGNVYRCPECNEIIHLPDNVGDKYRCPDCGTVYDVEDLEQLSIWDYMEDILDIEYRVTRNKEYRSCQICVAWGGPNIYIDTDDSYIRLYWWTERAEYPLSYAARDAIDEWAEEYWNM